MAENQFFIDSDKLSEAALERKHKLETDPSSRTNHMEYMPGMEQIDPTIRNKVLSEMDSYDYNKYTARDVQNALEHETCSVEDFKALLSPAAEPFWSAWHSVQRSRQASISEIRCICSHRFILQTTARITVCIADLTATTTFIVRN